MFEKIFILNLLVLNIFNCSGYIYHLDNLHSPCQKDYSVGYCVPTKGCCKKSLIYNDNYERGNCASGKYCCPTGDVSCQECLIGFKEINGTCLDINECDSFGVCSAHNCYNSVGSYECECFDGFEMIGKLKTCKHKNHSEILEILFTETIKINLFKFYENEVKTAKTTMLYSGTVYPKSIDYSFSGNYMAWTDISSQTITITPINYRNPSSVFGRIISRKLNYPYILSIDWIHDLIYWTDLETKSINVLNVNKPYDYYTVVNNTNEIPKDFKVNVVDSCLIWTIIGSKPRIMRSLQDGSNQRVLYSSDKQPFYITIDILLKRYFFVDIGRESLYTIDFDGNQGQSEIKLFGWSGVLSNVITSPLIYGDIAYFLTESTIYACNKLGKDKYYTFGTNGKSLRASDSSRLFDMKIMDPLLQPPDLKDKCRHSQCSHICLPSDETLVFRCLCPQNYILINNSICFEKRVENFLIEAMNREKNFEILFNYVINKTLVSAINKTRNTKHEISYNITHLVQDNRKDGQDVLLILIILCLISIIVLMIGFRLKPLWNKTIKCPRHSQDLCQIPLKDSTNEIESNL